MLKFIIANARWLSAGLLLCLFSGFGQTYFISLSNDAIRAAHGLSHSQFGLIYGGATLASAFTLSNFGKLVDRFSVRRSAILTVLGLSLACTLMAISSLTIVILPLAIFGLRLFGQGFCGHVAMTSAGKWYTKNRGKAVSVVGLGFPLSESFMPAVAAVVLSTAGLAFLWGGAAVVLLVLSVPLLWLLLSVDRVPQEVEVGTEEDVSLGKKVVHWTRSDILKRPEFYLVQIAALCPPFMVTAYFFHQQHLSSIMSWDMKVMVASMTVFAAAQVITSLVAGNVIDRFNAKVLLPAFLLPISLALMVPLVLRDGAFIPLLYVGLGMTAGAQATLSGALWPELFGTRHLGDVRALIYAIMVASTAASPFLTGFLIDFGVGFDLQLAVMGAFSLLASGVMLLIQPNLAGLNEKLGQKQN